MAAGLLEVAVTCRSCSGALEEVVNLGNHYLPDFVPPGTPRGKPWPLRLMQCASCTLLQLAETTPRSELYHERYGFRSSVNEAVRADLADCVSYALGFVPNPGRWLDIACNDGTLLSFVPEHVRRAGIDPLCAYASFAGPASRHGKITGDYFAPDFFGPGEFDVITSVSMFYDLDDPCEFATGVAKVLATRGCWVIQQNYALDLIRRNAVDTICHEHVATFSVRSLAAVLERAGLEITDVAYSDVNGGCVRTLVGHEGARQVRLSVAAALAAEQRAGIEDPETWRAWAGTVTAELAKTRAFLDDAKAAGRTVGLLGASTRGGTILQMIGAGLDLLPYAVERQPGKVGKVMAATGIPIISEEEMRANPPHALLVSPWFFRDVLIEREATYLKAGGLMAFPLPHFEVTGGGSR